MKSQLYKPTLLPSVTYFNEFSQDSPDDAKQSGEEWELDKGFDAPKSNNNARMVGKKLHDLKMTQVLTVSCKLKVLPEQAEKLDAVLSNFAKCCEFVNCETPKNLTNQIAVQSLIYKSARVHSGLSSQLTILAIRRVCGNRKTAKQKNKPVRKFTATSANYDSRTFTFYESKLQVSLTMMKGREQFFLAIGNYQRHLLSAQKPKSATLVKRKNGDYYLQIQLHSEPPRTKETDKCLGVDLGRRDIAVTSAGHSFSGEQTTKIRAHFSRVRQSIQQKASKGTSEFTAKMPSISGTVKWT